MSTKLSLDEMPAELQELLSPRVERLGYLGEFFQYASLQPESLAHFIRWTETLKEALNHRLVEAIALTIASRTNNEYEQVQHERLALKTGFSEEEIRCLIDPRAPSCATLTREELAAAALAGCIVDGLGTGCEPALLRLTRLVGEEEAVGCLMMAARYLAHAVMSNTWRLRAPVPSPLAESES